MSFKTGDEIVCIKEFIGVFNKNRSVKTEVPLPIKGKVYIFEGYDSLTGGLYLKEFNVIIKLTGNRATYNVGKFRKAERKRAIYTFTSEQTRRLASKGIIEERIYKPGKVLVS